MIRFLRGRWSLIALCALMACARRAAPGPPEPAVGTGAAGQNDSYLDDALADSIVGPPRALKHNDLPPRSNGELMRQPDLNQSLTDVRRLGLITGVQEMRLGLLRLEAGPSFARGTSVSYNFNRLRRAYRKSIDYYGDGILEIWGDGGKLGEYTVDGLLLGSNYHDPR